jgi:hypothetical protein
MRRKEMIRECAKLNGKRKNMGEISALSSMEAILHGIRA